MGIKFQKFFGWALLFAGLTIIFWGLYSSYNIFTGKRPAPEIFKIEEKVLPKKEKTLDLQTQIQEMIKEQLKSVIPSETLPNLLNLIAWSIFAGILIFGGGQIAGLGIKLLK